MKQKWFAGYDWQGLLSKELEPPFKPDVTHVEDCSNFDEYDEIIEETIGKATGWNPVEFAS